jgi:hypothetical protein
MIGPIYVLLVTGINAGIGAAVGAAAGGKGRRGKGAGIGATILGGVGFATSTIEVVAVDKARRELAAASTQPKALR